MAEGYDDDPFVRALLAAQSQLSAREVKELVKGRMRKHFMKIERFGGHRVCVHISDGVEQREALYMHTTKKGIWNCVRHC